MNRIDAHAILRRHGCPDLIQQHSQAARFVGGLGFDGADDPSALCQQATHHGELAFEVLRAHENHHRTATAPNATETADNSSSQPSILDSPGMPGCGVS